MEFFIIGIAVGFIFILIGKDIKAISYLSVVSIGAMLIIGLFRMQTASPAELDKIAAETINSVVSSWVDHFLFDLGGYITGIMIGFLVGSPLADNNS
jgi:hypothetical protein